MQSDLKALIRDVSRSFYFTVRILPSAIRPQISLAYLLARATDTIADTDVVPLSERLATLEQLRERILGHSKRELNFSPFTAEENASKTTAGERRLLRRIEEVLAALAAFSPTDQQRVREVLDTITSGQQLDLNRFAGADARHIVALRNHGELDDYTYRVAGCVGEFWTKMCRAHLLAGARLDEERLLQNSVRFGKGLQLVNILRDLPLDLQSGRCYMPEDRLAEAGLKPADLLKPANEPRFRALYAHYLDVAMGHLGAGWEYTNALPRGQVRLRLACAWPILIGSETVKKLRLANVLDTAERVKVRRADVRRIIARSVRWYPWPARWRELFHR